MATRQETETQLKKLERVFQQFEKYQGNQQARKELLAISNLPPETFKAAYRAYKEGRSLEDYNFIDALAQGLTFGFGDEIKAWFQTIGQDEEAFDQRLGEIRAAKQVYETENPYASFGGELVGGIASTIPFAMGAPIAAGAAVAKAAFPALRGAAQTAVPTFTGQAVKSGAAGATEGFVSGVGRAEGDFLDRAGSATMDTVLGLGGGVAGPALVGAGRTLKRNFARNPDELVAEQIASTMGTRGIDEVAQRVQARQGDVRPEMLADIAGEAAQRKVRGARVAVPEFGQQLTEDLRTRQLGARERVLGDVEEAIGVKFDEVIDPEDIIARQQARAKADYDALRSAYGEVEIKDLEGFFRAPSVKRNYQKTIEEMQDRYAMGELSADDLKGMPQTYDDFMKMFEGENVNSVVAPFSFLETLQGKIGDDITSEIAGAGNKVNRTASSMIEFKDRFVSAIDPKVTGNPELGVPSFADARKKFADSSVVVKAYNDGLKMERMTPAQIKKFLGGKTESEREAFMQASYQALATKFRKEGANVADRIATDTRLRDQLSALTGDNQVMMDKLMENLRREQEMFRSSGVMGGGSVTADKGVDVEDFENLSQFGRDVENMGLIPAGAKSLYQGALQPIRSSDISLRAARELTETDPLRQLQTMSRVKEARPSQAMRERLIDGSGRLGRTVGMGAGILEDRQPVTIYTTPQARRLGLLD